MEIVIWICIILLFATSFIGLFIPVIPGFIMLWGGFILYHFGMDDHTLSILFWVAMAVFTILMLVADFVMNHYFVQKLGGSKQSQWGAIIGVMLGVFVYPPLGIVVVPFLIVFLLEIMQHRTGKEAAFAALGAIVGFLSGTVAKGLIQIIMIFWFCIELFI